MKNKKIKLFSLATALGSLTLVAPILSLLYNQNGDGKQILENNSSSSSSRNNYAPDLASTKNYFDSNDQGLTQLTHKAKKDDHLRLSVGMKDGFAYISEDNKVVIMNFDGTVRNTVTFNGELYCLEYQAEANHLLVLEKKPVTDFRVSIDVHSINSNGELKDSFNLEQNAPANESYSYQINTSYFINRFVYAKIGDGWFHIYEVNYDTGEISLHNKKGNINNKPRYQNIVSHLTSNNFFRDVNFGIISILNIANPKKVSYNIVLFSVSSKSDDSTILDVGWMFVYDDGEMPNPDGPHYYNATDRDYLYKPSGMSWVFDIENNNGAYNKHLWAKPSKSEIHKYFPFKLGLDYWFSGYHAGGNVVVFNLSSAFTLPYAENKKDVSYIFNTILRVKDTGRYLDQGLSPYDVYWGGLPWVKYFDYGETILRRIDPSSGSQTRIGKIAFNTQTTEVARRQKGKPNSSDNVPWSSYEPTISFESVYRESDGVLSKNVIKKIKAIKKESKQIKDLNKHEDYSAAGDPILLPSNNIEGIDGANRPFVISQDGMYYARLQHNGENDFVPYVASTSVINDVNVTLHKVASTLTDQELQNLVLQNIKYKVIGRNATTVKILSKNVFEQGQGDIVDFNKAKIVVNFELTNYLEQGKLKTTSNSSQMTFNVTYHNDTVREIRDLKINLSTNSVVQDNSAVVGKNQKVTLTPSYNLLNIFENQLNFEWIRSGKVISTQKQYSINSFKEADAGYYTLKVKFKNLDIHSESAIYLNLDHSSVSGQVPGSSSSDSGQVPGSSSSEENPDSVIRSFADEQITNLSITSFADEIATSDVASGQTLKLEAKVGTLGRIDYNQLKFKWYFYQNVDDESRKSELTLNVLQDRDKSTLLINNFTKLNAGKYEVELSYKNVVYLQATIINYSSARDKAVSHLSIEANSDLVAYNSNVVLKANVRSLNISSSDLSLKWYKLESDGMFKEIINTNDDKKILNINGIKEQTTYKLEASSISDPNVKKEERITISILENSLPVLSKVELAVTNTNPNLNSIFTLSANIGYKNFPNVNEIQLKWYKDNQLLKTSNGAENRFTIDSFQKSDNGNYKVEAVYKSTIVSSDSIQVTLNEKNLEKLESIEIANTSNVVNENSDLELRAVVNGSNLVQDNIKYKWYRTNELNSENTPVFPQSESSTRQIYKIGKLTKDQFNEKNEMYFKLVVSYSSDDLKQPIFMEKTVTITWLDKGLNYINLNGFTFNKVNGVEKDKGDLIAPYGATVTVYPDVSYNIGEEDKSKLSYEWYNSQNVLVSNQRALILKNIVTKDFDRYYLKVTSSDPNIKVIGETIKFNLRINNNQNYTPSVSLNNDVVDKGSRFTFASSITEEDAKKFLLIKNIDPEMVKINVEANDFWGSLKITYNIEDFADLKINAGFSESFVIENFFSIFWAVISSILVAIFIVAIVVIAILNNKKNKEKYQKDLIKYERLRSAYIAERRLRMLPAPPAQSLNPEIRRMPSNVKTNNLSTKAAHVTNNTKPAHVTNNMYANSNFNNTNMTNNNQNLNFNKNTNVSRNVNNVNKK